jgi:hypothetical protein
MVNAIRVDVVREIKFPKTHKGFDQPFQIWSTLWGGVLHCCGGPDGGPSSAAARCGRVADMAGVLIQEIKFVCGLSAVRHAVEAGSQQPTAHAPQGVPQGRQCVVQAGGTREPVAEMAECHAIMIASVLQALDAASNLYIYGIHWAVPVEDSNAQLGRGPAMLALVRSCRVQCGRINYCQHDHPSATTHV